MVTDLMVLSYLTLKHATRQALRKVHVSEAGEGVISAAIAVLIMAFLGAAMWVAFNQLFDDTADKTERKVDEIGR